MAPIKTSLLILTFGLFMMTTAVAQTVTVDGHAFLEFAEVHNGIKVKFERLAPSYLIDSIIGKSGNTLSNIHQIPFISPRCKLVPEISRFMISDISMDLILPSMVLDLLHSEKHYLLFAALGGYTGTLFTIIIARHLHNTCRKFALITSYPFKFEGKKRAAIADIAVVQLSSLPGFNPFRLDDLNKIWNLLLNHAFDFADRKMIELANTEFKTWHTITCHASTTEINIKAT